MTTFDRLVSSALISVSAVALVLSLGGSTWTAMWLALLVNACVTTLTLTERSTQ
jgi:hypothetical protein